MTLHLRITGFTDKGFTAPTSLQFVNGRIYKAFGDSDTSAQERGINTTTDLLHTWDDAWDLTVAEVVEATGISADRIVIINTD